MSTSDCMVFVGSLDSRCCYLSYPVPVPPSFGNCWGEQHEQKQSRKLSHCKKSMHGSTAYSVQEGHGGTRDDRNRCLRDDPSRLLL